MAHSDHPVRHIIGFILSEIGLLFFRIASWVSPDIDINITPGGKS